MEKKYLTIWNMNFSNKYFNIYNQEHRKDSAIALQRKTNQL